MAIKGLSINHISITVRNVNGVPSVGDVFKYKSKNASNSPHFVLCSFSLKNGIAEMKPIEGISSLLDGFEIDAELTSINGRSSFVVAPPGTRSQSGALLQNVKSITDITNPQLIDRHNLYISDARGKRWNTSFMDGTKYSNDLFDSSFMSVPSLKHDIATYTGATSFPSPCLLLTSDCGLLRVEDLEFYKVNNITFMSRTSDTIKTVKISSTISLSNHALNDSPKVAKNLGLTNLDREYLSKFCVCKFSKSIPLHEGFSTVNFSDNPKTFTTKDLNEHLLVINNQLDGSLIRAKVSPKSSGIIEIKNENSMLDTVTEGSFYGDYANEFLLLDDRSMIFIRDNDSVILIGLALYEDMVYNSGIVNINGRFLPEGKNSFGAFASSLSDSGNCSIINKISTYFDIKFTAVLKDIIKLLGSTEIISSKSIGVVNIPSDANSVDRTSQRLDKIVLLHNSFVGESLPAIVDGKFGLDTTCDNYVFGSAFLSRDVRPVVQNSNRKGNSEMSSGLSFSPQHTKSSGQSKSYFVPMHGGMDVLIPHASSLFDRSTGFNFSSVTKSSIGLSVDDVQWSKQAENLFISGRSCLEHGHIYSSVDGIFKYVRADGSKSNVVRHNDSMVLFCLSMQFLAFMGNNDYSKKMSSNQSLIFGFENTGNSAAVQCSFHIWNVNKGLVEISYDGIKYLVMSEDRNLAIQEMRRMISSIRSFSGGGSNPLFSDLVKIINKFSILYPKSDINKIKSSIIDAAKIVSQLEIFASQLGDPEVDVFMFAKTSSGSIDLSLVAESSTLKYNSRKYIPKNISTRVIEVLGKRAIASDGLDPIWSGAKIYGGEVYSQSGHGSMTSSTEPNISFVLDKVVKRWVSGIDAIHDVVSGYIISSRDDVSIVNDDEMSSRSRILVGSIVSQSMANKNNKFKVGVSFSPVSYASLIRNSKINLNSGYIINYKRIVDRIVKPSLDAGARVILQQFDVDSFIVKSFDNVDNFHQDASNALCFLENTYDPDSLVESFLHQDARLSAYFNGAHFSGISDSAFSEMDRLKGKNYFSSHDTFLRNAYPLGVEIIDSDVSFDRFNTRRKIVTIAQNLVSSQVDGVVDFVNEYKSYGSATVNNFRFAESLQKSSKAPVRLTNNLFGHNHFRYCFVNVGEEAIENHFTHNYFSSPYTGLKVRDTSAFCSADNFNVSNIFNRTGDESENYIERCNLFNWGHIENLYPSESKEFYTSSGFIVSLGEGMSYNEDDIIFRYPVAPVSSSGVEIGTWSTAGDMKYEGNSLVGSVWSIAFKPSGDILGVQNPGEIFSMNSSFSLPIEDLPEE